MYEELESKVRAILKRNKVKFRSLYIVDDKLIIGIEGTKSNYLYIIPKLKSFRLTPINIVYGRWVFKIR